MTGLVWTCNNPRAAVVRNPDADADVQMPKRRSSMDGEHQELARPISRYYQHSTSSMSNSNSPTDAESTYQFTPAPKKQKLSWRRSHQDPLPEPAQGLVFHIYRSSSLLSKKVYDITLADRETQAFHITFPRTGFSVSSRPDILVQRGGSSGPVVGEVRYHSWNSDEILLPLISASVAKLSTDGFFKKTRRIRFEGRDWFWRQVSGKAEELGQDGASESAVNARWKCTDDKGVICGIVSRTVSTRKIGRIAVTQRDMTDLEIEALVVCAMAMLEKEERRGSTSSSEGD